MPAEPPEAAGGVFIQVRLLLAALAQYASARLRLAAVEGREAGARVGKLLALGAAVAVLLAGGWFFLAVAFTLFLAEALGYTYAALGVGGLHVLLAALIILRLKTSGDGGALFPLTTEEFKKDQTWLEQQTQKKPD